VLIVKLFVRVSSKCSVREAGELSSGLMERQASKDWRPRMRIVAPYPNSLQLLEASRDA